MNEPRPIPAPVPVDLSADGLLWLINATVFHPRGFALGQDTGTGEFFLLGDGGEAWQFAPDGTADEKFEAVEALFARARVGDAPLDQNVLRECSVCHRREYSEVGIVCGMTQPDGEKCRGVFQ